MATMTTEQFRASIRARIPGREGEVLVEAFDALLTDATAGIAGAAAADARIDVLVTWANTLVAKLNADAGVTDVDYATTAA